MQIRMLQLSKEKYFSFQYVSFDFSLSFLLKMKINVTKYVVCYSNN